MFLSHAQRRSAIVSKVFHYSRVSHQRDIERLNEVWEDLKATRRRDAIYDFLSDVFDLVAWWAAEGKEGERSAETFEEYCLNDAPLNHEPFAIVLAAAANPDRIERRSRSKWSRVLRLAHHEKPPSESLTKFVKRKGGINACATIYARRLGRLAKRRSSMRLRHSM